MKNEPYKPIIEAVLVFEPTRFEDLRRFTDQLNRSIDLTFSYNDLIVQDASKDKIV